jgi:CRP-like cAMP-binding protein
MTDVMSEPAVLSAPVPAAAPAAFAALSPPAREALLGIARRRGFPAGRVALAEGARAEAFYAVLSGQLKMCRLTPSGRNLILSLFGPGDLFGVTPALSGEPCGTDWQAVEDSECLEVRRADLFALLERRPDLVPETLRFLTRHMVECKNCLVESACSRVESRFASLFLRLADKRGQASEGGWLIPLRLSRQELADLTGTTLETAIRVMSRWRQQGLVTTTRRGFVLHDRAGLEAMSWG